MSTYIRSFDPAYIDTQPLPQVSKELLPWLIKDRKEAQEGSYTVNQKGEQVHDGSGLDKAEQSLRSALTLQKDNHTDPKVIEFLAGQVTMAQDKVSFYKGKIYLLDKLIAHLKAQN